MPSSHTKTIQPISSNISSTEEKSKVNFGNGILFCGPANIRSKAPVRNCGDSFGGPSGCGSGQIKNLS